MPSLSRVLGTPIILLFGVFGAVRAQVPSAPALLSGTVDDPSGARIPHASLHIHSDSFDQNAATNSTGAFSLTLPPGTYTLTVDAPGFRTLTRDSIVLGPSDHQNLTLRLAIAARPEEVSVGRSSPSTNPADNRNAITFSGAQLQMLSDDPTVLRQQLIAMAGGGAGLSAPQFYIDGFSNGQLPPKSAIRSISINNNPYSAVFDRAGFGRIDIETRAGGDKLHGTFDMAGTANALNARNPYTTAQPPYHQLFFDGNLNGPITKKTTFFLAGNSTDLQNNAIVNAVILDPVTYAQTALSEAVPNPQRDDDYSLRLDRIISAANTLNGRYEIHRTHLTNAGVGLLVLPSEGAASNVLVQTLQLDDNDVVSPKIVNELRFQDIRTRLRQDPNDTSPSIIVEGAFSGGGSPPQALRDSLDHYEFVDDLSIDHGAHFLRAGGRYRLYRESNYSSGGYNGQFLFPNITAYQITRQALAANPNVTDQQIRSTCITTSAGPVCGGATQFNLTAGQHSASVFTGDLGLYIDDDWKLTSNFTLSFGLRYETQSAIPDHADPAPRLGFAWAIGSKKSKAPMVTLRGGAGIFYGRFDIANLLQAVRQNGTSQLTYFVQNPCFYPTLPPVSTSDCTYNPTATEPTIYRVDPRLHTAYDFVTSITAERSIGRIGSITANYLQAHGVHQYLSINANAPLPGTFNPADPNSGARPLGGTQNIYQYSSEGVSNGRVFFSNLNLNPKPQLFVWAFYYAQYNYSDVSGASAFLSNSYNIKQDYGPNDSNLQQLFCGFSWELPYGFSLQPYISAHTGRRFNITTGTDLNGDTIYNDRPTFATDLSRPSVVNTAFGNFDTNPLPTQTIVPYNYARAPGLVWVDLQASKSFHIGPRPHAAASAAPLAAPST
ncbi:MAG TPA: carboxypeptidase regulatory-like domain-containing protein, partial [Acidobacteriaceae bacterium]